GAKKLNFGTPEQLAANAKRTGIPNETLTVEQRSTPEWNAQALAYLNQLENWSKDLQQSTLQAFYQKAYWYRIPLQLAPAGRTRDTLLKSYVTFLATSPARLESPPIWLQWVKEVVRGPVASYAQRDNRDRAQWLDQVEGAGDKTIGLYVKLARLNLDAK